MAWRRIDVHRAVEHGDMAVLVRYLDTGGDPEKKDAGYGAALVHWASLVSWRRATRPSLLLVMPLTSRVVSSLDRNILVSRPLRNSIIKRPTADHEQKS